MDIFEFQDARVPARAVQQDEEEAAIAANASQPPMPPLVMWNEELCRRSYPEGMRVKAMVVATNKPGCSLLNHSFQGKKQLIGSLIMPEVSMKGNCVGSSLQDRTCLIFSCGEGGEVLLVVCQYVVAPERTAAFARALFAGIVPGQVIVLGSMSSEQYCGEGDASQETLLFMLSTGVAREAREKLQQKLGVPYLPTGNLVGGLPAALLSYCQVRSIRADLIVDIEMLASLGHLSIAPLAHACCEILAQAGDDLSSKEVVGSASRELGGGSSAVAVYV